MKYAGVIFDLDGTLADTLEDIADSMNRILSRNGFPTHPLLSYKLFVGKGIKNLVTEALPEDFRQQEIVENCFELMVEDYKNNCLNKTKLYAGITQLLDELSNRDLKLAVLSNKADELTKKIVQSLLKDWKFQAIIGARSNIPRKPDPMGALLISNTLNIPPHELLYVGDTGIDMNTANSAGMFAIGALWGFRSKEELLANGAKILLEHPLELIDIF